MTQLEEFRQELDKIDSDITELFVRRMNAAYRIAMYKQANGIPTLDAAREAQVLENHGKSVPPELCEYTKALFRELMRLSKDYQNEQRKL